MARGIKNEVMETSIAMKKRDKRRDQMFRAMDTMFHNSAAAPETLADYNWFRWSPTTTPSDAVWGATRVLSAIEPQIKFAPVSYTAADRERADKIERVLKTLYQMAGERSKSKHTRQIVWNAILYDSVAVQLDFLPFSQKNQKVFGGDDAMFSGSKRFGPFAVYVRNAKNVHTVHPESGLENVLFEQVLPTREVVAFWGPLAKDLEEMLRGSSPSEWVYVMDYWDRDVRAVWAHPMETEKMPFESAIENAKHWIVPPKKHGLPFIPWVSKGGGSTTEAAPELHYRPLLASIYQSEQYATMNLIRSLIISDEIAKFGEEDVVEETMSGEPAQTSRRGRYGPRNRYTIQKDERVYKLNQSQLDVGLLQLHDILQGDMSASTVSRILLGDVPNDIAFATLNLGQQSASRSIVPYKEVAQDALAEVLTQMLLWANFSKENLSAYIPHVSGYGREYYTINWDEFDPDLLQIKVELVADVPGDLATKTNSAAMAYERMGAPRRWALEQIGIPDASNAVAERFEEDLMETEKQNAVNALSTEFQQQIFQMVQEAVQQSLQQQQGDEARTGGAEPQESPANRGQGLPGIEGEGVNPAEGGAAAANFAPEATREAQTGRDRGGTEF